jgi:PilX N-terminal
MVDSPRSKPFGNDRANERGTAIFIVVMVLTMLTAIGVFAMRASSLAGATSGYERQNTQNHYAGEYGMLSVVTELSTTRRSAYVTQMSTANDKCWATKDVTAPGGGVSVPCYRLYAKEVQNVLESGRVLFDQSSGDAGGPVTPGSLGPSGLDGDFVVEMTDPGPVGAPVAGTDVGGTGPRFRYLQVTLTSIGQVRPAGDPTSCVDNTAALAGNEAGRAFVVIGPMP